MSSISLLLPDWVVCPLCRGDLERGSSSTLGSRLACVGCGARFAVQDGIPELLDAEGRDAAADLAAHGTFEGYHAARHVSPCNIQYYDFWCADMLSRLPTRPFRRVVELMAGGAELSRRSRGLPKPIVAIDLNRALLARGSAGLAPDIVPVCASALRLPFRDATVDLVLIQGGLHHVRRMVAPVLKEIARCMTADGVLLASEPRNDNPLNRGFRRAFYRWHPIPDEQEEDGFTRSELHDYLRDAGLVLEQYDPFAYLGYMLIGNTDLIPILSRMRTNWVSSFLIALDRGWSSLPLARGLGWASQILARKAPLASATVVA